LCNHAALFSTRAIAQRMESIDMLLCTVLNSRVRNDGILGAELKALALAVSPSAGRNTTSSRSRGTSFLDIMCNSPTHHTLSVSWWYHAALFHWWQTRCGLPTRQKPLKKKKKKKQP
jgi:hypothetical protein